MSKNLYRLVKPYESNKVYEASSIMHGAGKCYKEIKKTNTITNEFSMIDINSNNIYEFKINPSQQMLLKKNPDELLSFNKLNQNGGDKQLIEKLQKQINELNIKVKEIEIKISQNKFL
jgi:hypothetical protein